MTGPADNAIKELIGIWDVTMKTPIGSLSAVYVFTHNGNEVVGTATGAGEETPVTAVRVEGPRVTWRQSVRKPLRLNLEFDVEVRSGEMLGHSRAGRLPKTQVSGHRRSG
ncbi:hypothetical protein [Amycolatopsis pithecellobii]|uniref:Uncharacterized protein n=1 Tax=Amycolatopsis pithecellobii TaxID=664692 RepID=A0A6N7YWU2_9PSEU|nr:hypothetical protein [Amycolatopsis pithecellobii]MTD57557.1 hypothetical protein [Amycolatopsis pithecellobii]